MQDHLIYTKTEFDNMIREDLQTIRKLTEGGGEVYKKKKES